MHGFHLAMVGDGNGLKVCSYRTSGGWNNYFLDKKCYCSCQVCLLFVLYHLDVWNELFLCRKNYVSNYREPPNCLFTLQFILPILVQSACAWCWIILLFPLSGSMILVLMGGRQQSIWARNSMFSYIMCQLILGCKCRKFKWEMHSFVITAEIIQG